jgi:hypothetical protein
LEQTPTTNPWTSSLTRFGVAPRRALNLTIINTCCNEHPKRKNYNGNLAIYLPSAVVYLRTLLLGPGAPCAVANFGDVPIDGARVRDGERASSDAQQAGQCSRSNDINIYTILNASFCTFRAQTTLPSDTQSFFSKIHSRVNPEESWYIPALQELSSDAPAAMDLCRGNEGCPNSS